MRVTLVGTGCGDPGTMTEEVKNALACADVVIGAPRLLEAVDPLTKADSRKVPEIKAAAILETIQDHSGAKAAGTGSGIGGAEIKVCVAYSGDSGFYSGTRSLLPLLQEAGIEAVVMPGISSIQVMSARLQRPWQDWKLVSAHGTDCDPVTEVMDGKEVFFLTGGNLGPAELCQELVDAGLGELKVWVGERLSYPDEIILEGPASGFVNMEFDSLSVMLAEPAAFAGDRTPGIEDGTFIRGDIPMTKQTVRAAILSKMHVAAGDTVWDVGAGTGSVSVELAMKAAGSHRACDRTAGNCETTHSAGGSSAEGHSSGGRVWAIEREPEGCQLIEANKKKFGVWNLNVVSGSAPEALADLPAPDRVFIGGSSGNLAEIFEAVLTKNPDALICVSAIVLETMSETVKLMAQKGMDVDLIQVCVNTSKTIGKRHMMMAANPIYIMTGQRVSAGAENPAADAVSDAETASSAEAEVTGSTDEAEIAGAVKAEVIGSENEACVAGGITDEERG